MDSAAAMKNIGMGLAIIGIILLLGYSLYNFFVIESSLVLKISVGAIVAGIVLVLLILIKEKMGVEDKEIERRY